MSNNSLIPHSEEMKALETMAKAASDSKFFQALNGQAGIFSIMLYARELGLPPMQCIMGGMHNVQGKITFSAQLMNSMIRKAGHRIDILESSDQKCILKGTRCDTGETCTVSFSLEDAKKANVYKAGGSWDKYPSDMCFARALSRLARRLFADVIGTAYVEGEIEEKTERDPSKNEPIDNTTTIEIKQTNDPDLIIKEFKDKFSPLELPYAKLDDFLEEAIKKSKVKKNKSDAAKYAVENPEWFEKAYKKWSLEKAPAFDIRELPKSMDELVTEPVEHS